MDAGCRIELFGGLRLVRGSNVITRFRTHNTASLLAFLAMEMPRSHARDELLELLWPDAEFETGRGYLRTTLSYLRRMLEPPGVPYNHVLITDRSTVRLEPAVVTTDVGEFFAAREAAQVAQNPAEQVKLLTSAVRLYVGDLLEGFYDDWALTARQRCQEAFVHSLKRLVRLHAEGREYSAAIEFAQRILASDPLDEGTNLSLMRLYAATSAPDRAVSLFENLRSRLAKELGTHPSSELTAFAEKLRPLVRTTSAEVRGRPPETVEPQTPPASSTPSLVRESAPSPQIPLIPTAFFGREKELGVLERLLGGAGEEDGSTRLVTITGPGGVGKTRLAVEAGRQLSNKFDGTVCFVPLADLAEPNRILYSIASALRLTQLESDGLIDRVVARLRDRPFLLILDNFEQLVIDGAEVVSAMLRSVPRLACLVSSRRCLEIEGEQELELGPLQIPGSVETPEQMMEFAGVQLFSDRAQKVRPEFQVTPANAEDVAAIVRRLEGVPLALELAAARSRTLTAKQMREYLAEGLEVLVNRRAGKDARHRSLWAAIEWSYRLLSAPQRRAFADLSIFEGSWSLEAAQAVLINADAADTLDQLRTDSLIVAEEVDGEMRYRMLNTIREFASSRLGPDDRRHAEARHAAHFAELVHEAMKALKGPDQAQWLSRLDMDLDNIRAAFRHNAEDPGQAEDGLKLAAGMWRYWISRGLVNEGLSCSKPLVRRPEARKAGAIYVDALNSTGGVALACDDYATCREMHQKAAQAAKECSYDYGLGAALDDLGVVEIRTGDYNSARKFLEESLAIHRRSGNEDGIAAALTHLGVALQKMEAFEEAGKVYAEAADRFRKLNDRLQLATTLSNLGMIFERKSDYAGARALYMEGLEIHESMGNRSGAALALGNLGVLARTEGDLDNSRRQLRDCLEVFKELGMRRSMGIALTELGKTEEKLGNLAVAKHLHSESMEVQRSVGAKDGVISALIDLGRVQAQIGDAKEAATYLVEALIMCHECGMPHSAAEALDQLAAIAENSGRSIEAARLLGAADQLRDESKMANDYPERDCLRSRIRAVIGDAQCEVAFESGRSASPEDVIYLAKSLTSL